VNINYHFLSEREEKAKEGEEFVAALIDSKELSEKPEEKAKWIQYYKTRFPKGKNSF
jgi:hypothetical protein